MNLRRGSRVPVVTAVLVTMGLLLALIGPAHAQSRPTNVQVSVSPRSSSTVLSVYGGVTSGPSTDYYCSKYTNARVYWKVRQVSRARVFVESVKVSLYSNAGGTRGGVGISHSGGSYQLGSGWSNFGASSTYSKTYYPRRYFYTHGSNNIELVQYLQTKKTSSESWACDNQDTRVHQLHVR